MNVGIKTFGRRAGIGLDRRHAAYRDLDQLSTGAVDAMLLWGSIATVAYWLVFLLRLPGWWWYAATVILIGAAYRRVCRAALLMARARRRSIALFMGICAISAAFNVFTNRPDSDDIAFSHRAVVAASNLSAPFAQTDTALDPAGLPPLTPFHIFSSVEVTTALVAKALAVPQVWAIHMVLGSLVNFMLPAVYFLLLRFFGCSRRTAFWGTCAVLIFFAMSGNVHRDWGTFTIVRSWQGKCILIELVLPLALLYALRFNKYGHRADLLRLHAVTCCGIGLSSSGLFLVPFVAAAAAVSVAMWRMTRQGTLLRLAGSSTIVILPAVVSVLPWLGGLPPLGDISFYVDGGWPKDVWENLGMVMYRASLPLYAFYLVIAAWTLRRSATTKLLLTYLGVVAIVLLAPGLRDIAMAVVKPGAYWRLAYAFLVPLWVGLAVAGVAGYLETRARGKNAIGVAMLAAICVSTVVMKQPAINGSDIAMPGLKFPRGDLPGVLALSRALPPQAVVLADWQTVTSLGLLRPDLRFISTRPPETIIAFSSAGQKSEGELRAAVQVTLSSCDFSGVDKHILLEHWPRVSVLAFPASCASDTVRKAFALDDSWKEITGTGHTALVK